MAEKTELPTDKKKRDSAKKGQSWKSQDLISLLILFIAAVFLKVTFPPQFALPLFENVVNNRFSMSLDEYALMAFEVFYKWAALTFLAVLLPAVLPTLLMTRFQLATEAIKIDFNAINPINGFKKLFSLRNLKNGLKAVIYFGIFIAAVVWFWHNYRVELLSTGRTSFESVLKLWAHLAWSLVLFCLVLTLVIVLLDLFLEYKLHIKDLKMTKDEVKREYKESEGNPEIKAQRKGLARELLNEITKAEVKQSDFILANPTHIAIGIYINFEISDWPFISVLETNARAQAVVRYAEEVGVPVIRNIKLTRAIFKSAKKYTFIDEKWLDDIAEVLQWLSQVEMAYQNNIDYLSHNDPLIVDKTEEK